MADATVPTETDIEVARNGVMTQLGVHCVDINTPGLEGFIDTMVQVIASERAYTRFLNNCLHPNRD